MNKAIVAHFEERGVGDADCVEFLKHALEAKNSKFLVFHKGKMFMRRAKNGATEEQWKLVWLTSAQLAEFNLSFGELKQVEKHQMDMESLVKLRNETTALVLLGQEAEDTCSAEFVLELDATKNQTYFAVDMTNKQIEQVVEQYKQCAGVEAKAETEYEFVLPRALLRGDADAAELAIIGQAVSRLSWYQENKFSHKTGEPLFPTALGHRLRPLPKEGATRSPSNVYPRLDPVAICLVISPDGKSCLLGERARRYNTGFFSVLAGFVEQGESVEDACRREVFEESGIKITKDNIEIIGSQAWPIGSAGHSELMIGCIAKAETEKITFDTKELARCEWFTKAQVAKMLKNSVNASLLQKKLDQAAENSKKKEKPTGLDIEEGGEEKTLSREVAEADIDGLVVPPTFAIAHHLIKAWVENKHS